MGTVEGNYFFTDADDFFITKYGMKMAIKKIVEFKEKNGDIPPVFDTNQLAHTLFTTRKMMFWLFRNVNSLYIPANIKKRNGKLRRLNVPDSRLKSAQNIILKHFLSEMPVSKYATAYKKGTSLKENAAPHINKKYLLKIDLADFFSNIRFEQVYTCAFGKYYEKQIATILTSLCCLNDVLPQGAPTSPMLSNIVLKRFDDYFGSWCRDNGFSYTRYCDDITVSGNKPLYKAYTKAKRMIENMGFELNTEKTHFVTNGKRQSVTGLTVNEKVSVSREYKRKLRQEIYYSLKYKEATEKQLNELSGKINFVLQIEPDNRWFSDNLRKIRNMKNGR